MKKVIEQTYGFPPYERIHAACRNVWATRYDIDTEKLQEDPKIDTELTPFNEVGVQTLAREVATKLFPDAGADFEPIPLPHSNLDVLNRCWDFYTFICWITPQMVLGHDQLRGKEMWTKMVLALNPTHYENTSIISSLVCRSAESVRLWPKPKEQF